MIWRVKPLQMRSVVRRVAPRSLLAHYVFKYNPARCPEFTTISPTELAKSATVRERERALTSTRLSLCSNARRLERVGLSACVSEVG